MSDLQLRAVLHHTQTFPGHGQSLLTVVQPEYSHFGPQVMMVLSVCVLACCATHTQSHNYKVSNLSASRLPATTDAGYHVRFECDC